MFDANLFLQQSYEEANSTKTTPCPEGEFHAVVKSITPRQWQKKDDPTVGGLALDLIWTIEDEEVKRQLDRTEITVKQGIMLDITETGALDMSKGKNVNLGRLREALGLNVPGQAFSFAMIQGRNAKVVVKHRIDGEDIYADVKSVLKA